MKLRGLGVTALFLTLFLPGSALLAGEAVHPLCPLVLHQERADREERELAVDLAVTRLAAAESIFSLVDQLWEKEAVERMVYLTVKRDRDVARIQVKRQRLLLKRQEAEVAQYTNVCSGSGSEETAAEQQARLDRARRQYLQFDCHRIGKDLAISEVDLAYRAEVLISVQNLRKNHVATAQDVILAERDTELARKRVELQERRVEVCVSSGAAGGNG